MSAQQGLKKTRVAISFAHHIPHELIGCMFNFLTIWEKLMVIERTCREWRWISHNGFGWNVLVFDNASGPGNRTISEILIMLTASQTRRFPHTAKILFTIDSAPSDVDICLLRQHCPKLDCILIENGSMLTTSALHYLKHTQPAPVISEKGFLKIRRGFDALHLNHCAIATDERLADLLSAHPHLVDLCLDSNDAKSLDFSAPVIAKMYKLKYLSLVDFYDLTSNQLSLLRKRLAQLSILNLSLTIPASRYDHKDDIKSYDIKELERLLNHAQMGSVLTASSLSLRVFMARNRQSSSFITCLKTCSTLTYLDLCNCRIQDQDMLALTHNPRLITLLLHDNPLFKGECFGSLTTLSKLFYIDVSYCTGLTGKGIEMMLNLPVSRCFNVTAIGKGDATRFMPFKLLSQTAKRIQLVTQMQTSSVLQQRLQQETSESLAPFIADVSTIIKAQHFYVGKTMPFKYEGEEEPEEETEEEDEEDEEDEAEERETEE